MKIYMKFESEGKTRNGANVSTTAKTDKGIWNAGSAAYSGTPAALCGYKLDAVILGDGRRIERPA